MLAYYNYLPSTPSYSPHQCCHHSPRTRSSFTNFEPSYPAYASHTADDYACVLWLDQLRRENEAREMAQLYRARQAAQERAYQHSRALWRQKKMEEEAYRRRKQRQSAAALAQLFSLPQVQVQPIYRIDCTPASTAQQVEASIPARQPKFSSPEEAIVFIQRRFRSNLAAKSRLEAIFKVQTDFEALSTNFHMPSLLSFDTSKDAPVLLYNSTNAPFHEYEHALNNLLTRLDAITAEGIPSVKRARKALVVKIEEALNKLDLAKMEQYSQSLEKQRKRLEIEEEQSRSILPLEKDTEMVDDEEDEALAGIASLFSPKLSPIQEEEVYDGEIDEGFEILSDTEDEAEEEEDGETWNKVSSTESGRRSRRHTL